MNNVTQAEMQLGRRIGEVGRGLRDLTYSLEDREPSALTAIQGELMRKAADLVRVLAATIEGRSALRAMGAPGDWGYGDPIGDYLLAALQADGWYLRSDIIWSKPNPMPESVTDRPTKAHEYIFLLTKSARYFYDAEAIKERVTGGAHARGDGVNPKAMMFPAGNLNNKQDAVGDRRYTGFNKRWKDRQNASFSAAVSGLVDYRNKRTVWTIPTQPFPGAHFATFPQKLIEPCIKAGTSQEGCCAKCGAPFERILDDTSRERDKRGGGKWSKADPQSAARRMLDATASARAAGGEHDNPFPPRVTLDWRPNCKCEEGARSPCVVLDPFAGSGTTGLVVLQLGCRFVGIELSGEYIETLLRPRLEKAEEQGRLF